MTYMNLIYEIDGAIATIMINRPQALNALNTATLDDLLEVENELITNDAIEVVILTGHGTKAFVAGGDIGEMRELNPVDGLSFSEKGHRVLSNLEDMKKPVIAAVNGYALGGGLELALACDIIYASETARLGLPEVTLGIVPGFGGTQRLTRLIGLTRAKELIFTGKVITAQEAYALGLVNKVLPDNQLMAEVRQLAMKIASAGPIAVGLAKDCINRSPTFAIDAGLEREAGAFAFCCGTEDQKEAMTAFLEKRRAVFRGR
jgi:enoyl-CoA hydratase